MQSDRELLELAARAAGRGDNWWVGDDSLKWNPLTDDGDALRLAVKLNMGVGHYPESGERWANQKYCLDSHNNDDPYAATRRAIVRAAAEIGRSMA